jgi:predicted porin
MRNENVTWIASAQLDNTVDRKETWNLGTEYSYNHFALRGGYQLGYDETSYSFGAGFKVPTSIAVFSIDYAYTNMGDLEEDFISGVHRFSLKMEY